MACGYFTILTYRPEDGLHLEKKGYLVDGVSVGQVAKCGEGVDLPQEVGAQQVEVELVHDEVSRPHVGLGQEPGLLLIVGQVHWVLLTRILLQLTAQLEG